MEHPGSSKTKSTLVILQYILGSTRETTSGRLKSILPNAESKVQQMMRPEVEQMEDGATEVEVEVAEAAFQILNCVLCKSAWLPDDLQMLSTQKLGKNCY